MNTSRFKFRETPSVHPSNRFPGPLAAGAHNRRLSLRDPAANPAYEIDREGLNRHAGKGRPVETGVPFFDIARLGQGPDGVFLLLGPGLFEQAGIGHLVHKGLFFERGLEVVLRLSDAIEPGKVVRGVNALGLHHGSEQTGDSMVAVVICLLGKGLEPEMRLGLSEKGLLQVSARAFAHAHGSASSPELLPLPVSAGRPGAPSVSQIHGSRRPATGKGIVYTECQKNRTAIRHGIPHVTAICPKRAHPVLFFGRKRRLNALLKKLSFL